MQRASIIVVPSVWDEPFGLVVAEAMSNGVAIITSKVGGIPEIIQDNGIVIKGITKTKVEKALLMLLNNSKEIKRLQKISWKNFSHTSISSAADLDFYRSKIMFKS